MSTTFRLILFVCLSINVCAQTTAPRPRVEWNLSDPRCDQIFLEGDDVRIIRDNNLVLMVSGMRDRDFIGFDVSVLNESDRRVNVNPASTALVIWKNPQQKLGDIVKRLEPEKIASKYRTRAAWANALRAFGAGMATNSSTTYGTTSGVSPAGADSLHPYGVALVSGTRRPFLRAGNKINAKYFSALATPLVLKGYENKSQRRNRSFIHL